jgi:hypothetical protein
MSAEGASQSKAWGESPRAFAPGFPGSRLWCEEQLFYVLAAALVGIRASLATADDLASGYEQAVCDDQRLSSFSSGRCCRHEAGKQITRRPPGIEPPMHTRDVNQLQIHSRPFAV